MSRKQCFGQYWSYDKVGQFSALWDTHWKN